MNRFKTRLLEGIVPPLVTPLAGRDLLDEPGLERLIEHIIAGGVHGLCALGTSDEAPSLSYRLRRELITRVCRQVNGRLPVMVGIYNAAWCGNEAQLAKLQERLLQIYSVGEHASAATKAMKCALSLVGICSDELAEPLARFQPARHACLRAVLGEPKLLPEPNTGVSHGGELVEKIPLQRSSDTGLSFLAA